MDSVNRFGPELILLAMAGVIILADLGWALAGTGAERWRRGALAALALTGTAASIVWSALLIAFDEQGEAFSGMISVDAFALFFNFLFAGIAAIVILSSIDFLRGNRFVAEYYALVLASTAGMMLLASTIDLIAIFVALELTGISLYILVAFMKDGRSSEAGLKYLLLGAISSAVALYGMAYLFGITGSTSLDDIGQVVSEANTETRSALVLAMVFLIAGFGFKMAIVPFQMWVPDVYEGAPTPVTAFLSVGSKAAGFAVVMRIFLTALSPGNPAEGGLDPSDWAIVFAILAAISMSLGNITALVQGNIKRMLGYSSIAQAGTFLIGLAAVAAADPQLLLGTSSVLFFLGTYAFTNLGAFIAIIAISNKIGSDEIADYAGVAKRSPLLALGLTICLLSLTGIPPTAGFIAKVYVFNAAVQADLVWLAIVGVLNSVIAAYYYLRVVLNMYTAEPASEESIQPGYYLGLAMVVAVVGLLVVGIFPSPLLEASEAAAEVFS
ncbi:MAG: NADH-quinone oxidoreductase subunit N [Chloroflexi bacterium]|nr:NADH-quinone oxidoreductase subunit N [Chloroflexota bacterium]